MCVFFVPAGLCTSFDNVPLPTITIHFADLMSGLMSPSEDEDEDEDEEQEAEEEQENEQEQEAEGGGRIGSEDATYGDNVPLSTITIRFAYLMREEEKEGERQGEGDGEDEAAEPSD